MTVNTSAVDELVNREKIALVFQYSKKAPLVNILLSLLTLISLVASEHTEVLFTWFSSVVAVALVRIVFVSLCEEGHYGSYSTTNILHRFALLILLNGLLWGVLPFFVGWSLDVPQEAFIPIFLAALTAGGLSLYSPILWLAQSYIAVICIPFGIYCATGNYQSILFGVSVITYATYLASTCRSMNAVTEKTLLLDIEKDQLIARLNNSKKEAESASQSKSNFLARMSHEIRTPLNGILGVASLVRESIKDPEIIANIETIHSSGEVLLEIVNDILDVAKIEAGKVNLRISPFHLGDELKRLEGLFAPFAKAQEIRIRFDVDERCKKTWLGDVVRIGQVLTNLISNAIKFTPRNGEVVLKAGIQGSNTLLFSVEDTGIGIPKRDLHRIFNAFEQVDGSMSREFGGSGLGLTICSFLVSKMGGKLEVTSLEHIGSTFSFSIKLEPVDDLTKKAPRERGKLIFDPPISVLLAEDNFVNQVIARKMLEKSGCRVTTVENGHEALKVLDENSFDVVLLDCQMPVLDGYETAKAIRKWEEDRKTHLPIVAVTAQSLTGDREKCISSGMDGFVSKPFNFDALVSEIQRVMSEHEAYLC